MKRILIILVIIIILLVNGCVVNEVDQPINEESKVTTKESNSQPTNYDVPKTSKINTNNGNIVTKNNIQADYSLEQLKSNIGKVYEKDNLNWRKNNSYYNVEPQRMVTIEVLEDPLKDSRDYYERFSAKNWEGYPNFFKKEVFLYSLKPKLTEDKFPTRNKYREYDQQGYVVDQKFIEKTIELENGYVQEYQLINWMFNKFGNHEGAWADTLLIYKIYCSPYFVVFIRPYWEQMNIGWGAAQRDTAYANWNSIINNVKSDLLNKSNLILEACPVQKEDFMNMPKNDYLSEKELFYYYPADLELFWLFSTDITDVDVENAKDDDGNVIKDEFILKKVNVKFQNLEPIELGGVFELNINTVNEEGETTKFVEERKVPIGGLSFKENEIVSMEVPSIAKPKFSNKLEVTVNLYDVSYPNWPVRPTKYLISTDGTIEKITS